MDALKYLYQSACGCGHLLPEETVSAERIQQEMADHPPEAAEPLWEPLEGDLCRLNLRHPLTQALPAQRIARMMRVTDGQVTDREPRWQEALSLMRLLATPSGGESGRVAQPLPFSRAEVEGAIRALQAPGALPPSHSESYRAAYRPAYRVVLRRVAEALPALVALERELERNGRALLVLDGPCASGKTSLAALLAPLYDAPVIHMDDFFLPPDMRTPARMAEPGGNVHYERFAGEVLAPLQQGGAFEYPAYDCHTGESHSVAVPGAPVILIEGSYALHPKFAAAYTALHATRALLTVSVEQQVERIRRRNGETMLKRFVEEWIPLENRYFQAYHKAREDELILPWAPEARPLPKEGSL